MTAAAVVIPTFNGEEYLERLLTMLEKQEFDGDIDILVIDSGSTDGSLPIVRAHPRVRLHQIPNEEFGHGRTRDLGVRMTDAPYIAFLTQDAIPLSPLWLAELLAPFAINERIGLVTGRQHPRASAFPLQKYDVMSAFAVQGPAGGTSIFGNELEPLSAKQASMAGFHSDVNAAVRRDLAAGLTPFRDVRYSEDQLMARDVLAAGYWRAYAGRAAVEHSNDLTLREHGSRVFDETVGLRRAGFPFEPMSRRRVVMNTLQGSIGDSIRILRDPDYGNRQRLRWLAANPVYQWRRWSAMRAGIAVDVHDDAAVAARSLEHERKNRG